MARRLAKAVLWLFGGMVTLALIAYLVLFAANLQDRPPAAEIAVLQSLQEDASPVASDSNSYLFMLGFAGPPDSEPISLGIERYEWMQTAAPEFDASDDPLPENYAFRTGRSDAVSELATACSESGTGCARALASDPEIVDRWIADERWLLDRYRSLIGMTEFSEATPFQLLAPLPPFDVIREGQRLHMADAWRDATAEDASAVRHALDRDLAYWRMVLRYSDVLITKMIASSAVDWHFQLGNVVLRRLPQDVAVDGIPMSWRNGITDAERSMKRTLAGEWMFFNETTRSMAADSGDAGLVVLSGYETWDRAIRVVLKPFWQPQDLANRQARLMLDLGNVFDVPYDDLPRAVDQARDLQVSAYRPFSRLYNFTGDLVMAADFWAVADYAVRVSDLEGIRRAALLAAELRADGTSKEDVARRLLGSEIVNPYTDEPFTWADEEGAIIFQGLERRSRGRHKLIF